MTEIAKLDGVPPNISVTITTPSPEFVSLTYEEHKKLVDKFGEADTKRMIEILDNYKGSNGKKYRSDYRAILSWVTDRLNKEKQSQHDNMKIDTFNHSELEKLTRANQ